VSVERLPFGKKRGQTLLKEKDFAKESTARSKARKKGKRKKRSSHACMSSKKEEGREGGAIFLLGREKGRGEVVLQFQEGKRNKLYQEHTFIDREEKGKKGKKLGCWFLKKMGADKRGIKSGYLTFKSEGGREGRGFHLPFTKKGNSWWEKKKKASLSWERGCLTQMRRRKKKK